MVNRYIILKILKHYTTFGCLIVKQNFKSDVQSIKVSFTFDQAYPIENEYAATASVLTQKLKIVSSVEQRQFDII